jgi:membrane fusion protein (multidrug efflux system)
MSTRTVETREPAAHVTPNPRTTGPERLDPAPPDRLRAAANGEARTVPAAAPALAPSDATPARARRNPIALVVAALVVLALAGLGVRQWLFGRGHVSTDNAQIEGDVVPILPRVSGFVAEVRVKDNQRVRAGETLVVLDDRDLVARLAQTQADLAAAEASVRASGRDGQAVAQIAAARAMEADAEATAWKADADLARFRSLASQSVISAQELDGAEAASRGANAKLDAARGQVHAAEAGLTFASARIASARAARDQAALQLSYTRLVAPSSGVVSKKNVEVGELVQVGQPLMSVVPIDDVWVVANLKETEVANVTAGQPVEVRVDSYPGRRFRGRVESLSPASGARFSLLPPDNATGNFTKVVQRIPVRIRLDGAQDPQHVLRPGMSVNVVITTA